MLVEIPPKVAVSSFMGYLKGKSNLIIYEKFLALRYKYRNREFWCREYYVDTAGKNVKKAEYVKNLSENKQMRYNIHQRRWAKWRKRATSH